jgi:hypothetical protein
VVTGLDRTSVYQRDPDVVTRQVAGETLLVPIRGQLADLRRIFSLNAVGALVWSRLDGVRDVGALCADVADEFEVEPSEAEESVRVFLEELHEAGLTSPASTVAAATGPAGPSGAGR